LTCAGYCAGHLGERRRCTAATCTFAKWERGNFPPKDDLFAPDIRFSATQPEGQVRADGRAEMERFLRGFFAT